MREAYRPEGATVGGVTDRAHGVAVQEHFSQNIFDFISRLPALACGRQVHISAWTASCAVEPSMQHTAHCRQCAGDFTLQNAVYAGSCRRL